ncbi:hypothetical protein Q5P01_023648 [Channa striata]|uniref:Uncharacterized protein n=1 Tax=Channa striata TaxID=64152 RepID=A0AA88IUS7_CHASR|nr:hypothetical protein Q5P01_023648 [Channa striata]
MVLNSPGAMGKADRRKQAKETFHLSLHPSFLPSLPSLKLRVFLSALQLSAAQPSRQPPSLQHCVNM